MAERRWGARVERRKVGRRDLRKETVGRKGVGDRGGRRDGVEVKDVRSVICWGVGLDLSLRSISMKGEGGVRRED